jgi:hypothetical protein
MSIEASRKALRNELKKNCKGKDIITRVIPFTNDDVPKYLELLERVEAESRKTIIMVS